MLYTLQDDLGRKAKVERVSVMNDLSLKRS